MEARRLVEIIKEVVDVISLAFYQMNKKVYTETCKNINEYRTENITNDAVEEEWETLTLISYDNMFKKSGSKMEVEGTDGNKTSVQVKKLFRDNFYNGTPAQLMEILNKYKKIEEMDRKNKQMIQENLASSGLEYPDVVGCCSDFLDIPKDGIDILELYEESDMNNYDVTSNPQYKYMDTLRKFKKNENADKIYDNWVKRLVKDLLIQLEHW